MHGSCICVSQYAYLLHTPVKAKDKLSLSSYNALHLIFKAGCHVSPVTHWLASEPPDLLVCANPSTEIISTCCWTGMGILEIQIQVLMLGQQAIYPLSPLSSPSTHYSVFSFHQAIWWNIEREGGPSGFWFLLECCCPQTSPIHTRSATDFCFSSPPQSEL